LSPSPSSPKQAPYQHQAGSFDGFGELGILGEEAVARMDRFGARLLSRADDLIDDR